MNEDEKRNIKTSFYKKTSISILILFVIVLAFVGITKWSNKHNKDVIGAIYFNKPVSWDKAYAYLYNNENELTGKWPGVELIQEKDYIYYLEITNELFANENDIYNCKIVFNNGEDESSEQQYKIEENFIGYNKIYNITSGLGGKYENTTGEWIEYSQDIKIGKIPTTESRAKNVIYMIGDGMGENHIIAAGLYNGEKLNIQTINNKSYVTTASTTSVTDSAAGATALATGYKTINGMIGKDKYGNDVENLIEYANSKGLKTGIVCTQILNHATPAGFSVHNIDRYNYDEIAQSQINSEVELMLGGGRKYFSKYESEMLANNYKWINNISELKNINKNDKVIGTFANESISSDNNRVSLEDMTKKALSMLENDNGFLLMIEGSDIDTYSHDNNMARMLTEMIDFDNAVGVAMKYVDENPDTLLIITADHETGGLILDGVSSKEQLTDSLFTSYGQHTQSNVLVYAYGLGARDITKDDIIDNTSIYKFVRQTLSGSNAK